MSPDRTAPPAPVRATRSGTVSFGDTDVALHVLADGSRVVEVATIEALLGLPDAGLGAFLATLPGSDRVRFRTAGRWATGLPVTKMVDMLLAFWAAHNGTPAGARAGAMVRAALVRGMRASGVDPAGADFLMAAAMPPKEER